MTARAEYRRCAAVWLALVVLLALTAASAYVPLGNWNAVLNLVIATAKVLLVALFFMHLKAASALVRLMAGMAVFMLALLFVLSLADYRTRATYSAPWEAARHPPPHAPSLR